MKKGLSLFLSVLFILTILSACGNKEFAESNGKQVANPTVEPRAEPAAAKPVEIEFWHGSGGQIGEVLQQQVDEFNKTHENIHVNAIFQQSYDVTGQKLQAAVVGGDVPDVVQLNTRVWPVFAENGALLALDDFIQKDAEFKFDDFEKGLLVNTALHGKQYTIPYNRSTPILYYNKDIMKELGENPEHPAETWDDLYRIAKKATIVKDGKTERFGFAASMSGWYFYSLVWSNGGAILGDDLKSVKLDQPEAARGLQLWSDMINKDKSMMPPVGGTSTSGSSAGESMDQRFMNGQIAFMIGSTGSLGKLEKISKFELGASFLPKFKTYATPTGGANLAIPAKSPKEKQQAAWEFIKFMTSKEQAISYSMKTGYLPIRVSAKNSPELQAYYDQHPNFKVALEQLQYAKEVPPVAEIKRIETEINKAMEKTVVDNLSAEQVLGKTANSIREFLK